MAFDLPALPELDDPLLGFRFGVFFLGKIGVAHPLDFRFQSISGLSINVEVTQEGGTGPSVSGRVLPESLTYSNLVLKRGMPLFSTLSRELHRNLNDFSFSPRSVLVSVMDENAMPLNSWIFSEAFPVKWSLSGLDADSNSVVVEEMELNYKSFKPFLL